MSKFRRFAPIEVRFLPFGYFPVDKNREEIRDFRIWEGEKIRIFGQNIYPCKALRHVAQPCHTTTTTSNLEVGLAHR